MTSVTKKASKKDSARSKKQKAKSDTVELPLYHVYRVHIDVNQPDAEEARARVNREMLAMLVMIKKDFPYLVLDSKIEISSTFEEMDFI